MDKLENALRQLENSDSYPFHMPGHKRRPIMEQLKAAYAWDITEIDGFDNLHHPEGILKEEQEFAKRLFGAEESFFLVNGSSSGVLGAIVALLGTPGAGDRLLMGRNAHQSAYHALFIADKKADYLYPERLPQLSFAGEISPKSVEEALKKNTSYAGIFLTSPTYEGIISDIRGICTVAHQKNIPVIVDEAHGAYLGIWGGNGYFPPDALAQGADVVIQSLHKTLPAMTQTAIVHVQGNLIDRQRLRMGLRMFQSSSPSYILMESIISCLHYCQEHKERLAGEYKAKLENFYREAKSLSCLRVWTAEEIDHLRVGEAGVLRQTGNDSKKSDRAATLMDPGKLVIGTGTSGWNGKQLYDRLRETYHLQMEMAAQDYVLAMTSVMDTKEGFDRLLCALRAIDREAMRGQTGTKQDKPELAGNSTAETAEKPGAIYKIREALQMTGEAVPMEESGGRISQEFVCLYPPGIPLIVPGERIPSWLPAYLKRVSEMGLKAEGLQDEEGHMIHCITNI